MADCKPCGDKFTTYGLTIDGALVDRMKSVASLIGLVPHDFEKLLSQLQVRYGWFTWSTQLLAAAAAGSTVIGCQTFTQVDDGVLIGDLGFAANNPNLVGAFDRCRIYLSDDGTVVSNTLLSSICRSLQLRHTYAGVTYRQNLYNNIGTLIDNGQLVDTNAATISRANYRQIKDDKITPIIWQANQDTELNLINRTLLALAGVLRLDMQLHGVVMTGTGDAIRALDCGAKDFKTILNTLLRLRMEIAIDRGEIIPPMG